MDSTQLAAIVLAPMLSAANQTTVFSPLSLIHALAILYSLSEDIGMQQMNELLNMAAYDPLAGFGDELTLAANVFLKQLYLQPEYAKKLYRLFNCVPQYLYSAKQVNTWVEYNTAGHIKNLVENVENADAILLSAVYFKQLFKIPFDPKLTTTKAFRTFSGSKDVKMMRHNKKKLQYIKTYTAQVVDLQYEKGVIGRVILPLQAGYDALNYAFNQENLKIATFSNEINLEIPKFIVESKLSLKEAFIKAGCTTMFAAVDCQASLGRTMVVDDVIQKAYISVDEEGTVAAAATAVVMRMTSTGYIPKTVEVICNRPFWFVLMKQNKVLFVVKYVE